MSYAINATNTGFRAINSQADLLAVETYSETVPVLPAPPAAPLQVTPYQFKAALVQANLYTQALAAVNAADQLTQLAWNEALTFIESDPIVTKFAAALGQSTAQVHALFQLAGTLSP